VNTNDVDSDATDAGFTDSSNLPRHQINYSQQQQKVAMSSRSHVSSSLGEENEEVESEEMIATSSTYSPSSSVENAVNIATQNTSSHHATNNRVTVKSIKAKKSQQQQKPASILIETSSLIQKAVTTTTTCKSSSQSAAVDANDADVDEAVDTRRAITDKVRSPAVSTNIVISDLRSFKRDNYYKFNTLTANNSSTLRPSYANGGVYDDKVKFNTVKSSAMLATGGCENGYSSSSQQCRVLPILINTSNVAASTSTVNMNTSTFGVQQSLMPASSVSNMEQHQIHVVNASGGHNGVKDDSMNAAENASLGMYFFFNSLNIIF
jgi:hypothetical protein